ncbi:unnamed protein product [Blepharisma stoltei]|uniref:transketolase n=1 Tax=Blepharisma stoltei TaxID=1481888 RepID=A0AAU9JR09_9CILI|nr:unnamed protein product [Blepharisma stoltei]
MVKKQKSQKSQHLLNLTTTKKRALESGHGYVALRNYATRMRIHSVESTTAAGSGHPTSCSSLADLMAVLFFDPSGMHYYPKDPRNCNNDKLVLSKGHAAPILYAAWAEAGFIPVADLITLRQITSNLEGHPTPRLEFVDVASGSLGQGLSAANGMAYSMKYLEGNSARVYCIMGDGECAEGSVWEAINFASHYQLDNLVAIVDVNRLGQSDPTMFQHDIDSYKAKFEAFGWNALAIDGHDYMHIVYAFEEARKTKNKPTAIIAKTYKGKDFTATIEDQENWHGKPIGNQTEEIVKHLTSLIQDTQETSEPVHPTETHPAIEAKHITIPAPNYTIGAQLATRNAYGEALRALGGVDERIVGLDGDTKNSTYACYFQQQYPQRFIECYIAEQNMVGVSLGLSCRGKIPFSSTFGAFFSRTYDQIRMSAVSLGNMKFAGSHCGVSIGEDGPSQMALEDLALFRSIPGSIVLYPSDAVSAWRAVELAANHKGIAFIRTSRPAFPVLYENDKVFEAGKSYTIKHSDQDKITVIGAGVTLAEAVKAHDLLASEGIHIRVVDLFSVKPIDVAHLTEAARATEGKILTVEDHYQAGGIFEAVTSALAQEHFNIWGIFVNEIPRSGKPHELLDLYGLSAAKIALKVKEIIH